MTRTHIKPVYLFFRLSGIIPFLLLLICSFTLKAQIIWENPKSEIYDFLSRQAQKGNIQFSDFIQPVSRKDIAMSLLKLRDSVQTLSVTESKELAFYLKEYSEFNDSLKDTLTFLKKDQTARLRFLSVKKGDFLLQVDPFGNLSTIQSSEKSIVKKASGLQFWGHAGKNISFQASFRDISESGTGLDSLRLFTPETGIVRTTDMNPNSKTLNYSDLRGYVTYGWNNGSISLGKDQLLWGYGENGHIVLSDKAPPYPFVRLDYQPLKWLKFHYAHAWLNSAIIDSARTYDKGNSVYGNDREFYIPKFMVTHSFNFLPSKGVVISLGESMIYSDRLDAAYFIPIMFFKAYDQYASRYKITTGSNSQFFLQASSRNNIPKTHLYSTLFIDEIRTSTIANKKKSRNQIGFTTGISTTDIFIPYLTLGVEYTRLHPFIYHNLIPAQAYTNHTYPLGDWMDNNADRLIAYIKYTPLPRLKTTFQIQKIREGSEGTLEQQYFAEPQPGFLFGLQNKYTELQLKLSYEWINNLYIQASIIRGNQENIPVHSKTNSTQGLLSISFGL